MPQMVGQKELQRAQKLPFCYICGVGFDVGAGKNRDHVPPSACIAQKDKAHSPLILPTHLSCNSSFKVDDERAGQFLSLLHGKLAKHEDRRLEYKNFFYQSSHAGTQAVTNVDMYGIVSRWVRAFHAALYMVPLPANTRFATELPLSVISPVEDGHIVDTGRPRQRTLCEEVLRRNRLTKTIDRIAAWNGKLQYECVWSLTALHAYCVFWLDFYNWSRMARLTGKAPADCVGIYVLSLSELPAQATVETQIITSPSSFTFGL